MKAPIEATIYIDDKEFGEFSCVIELPDDDEENAEAFDKALHDLLKYKIMEDEQMKAFVIWILGNEGDKTETETAYAVTDFFDRRMKLDIRI